MDESMGSRLKSAPPLKIGVAALISLSWSLWCMCSSAHSIPSKIVATTRVHVGTREQFAATTCYSPVEAHDADEVGDMAKELTRRLAASVPNLKQCAGTDT